MHPVLGYRTDIQGVWIADKVLFAASTLACLLVLGITVWIYRNKEARTHLRRVSFRLMVWALCFQLVSGLFKIIMLADVSPSSCVMGCYSGAEGQTYISRPMVRRPAACATIVTLFFQCVNTCVHPIPHCL